MRRLVVLLTLLIAGPAAADPALVGKHRGDGPVRYLQPDLTSRRGSPKLPGDVASTVLSPGGGRYIAAGASRTVTIRDVRTGRVRRTLRVPAGALSWPDSAHVQALTVTSTRVVVRALDLRSGRTRTQTIRGRFSGSDQVGSTLRLLVGRLDSFRITGFDVVDVQPDGRIARTVPVTLPADFAAGNTIMSGTRVSLSGTLLLIERGGFQPPSTTEPCRHLIERVGGQPEPLVLPGDGGPDCAGGYDWIGDDFLGEDLGGHLVRLDRGSRTITKAIATQPNLGLTPYAGGVIAGFGRARYDAALDLVAENPKAADDVTPSLVSHGRIYGLRTGCRPLVRIADARTGLQQTTRRGRYKVGELGGRLAQNGLGEYPDDC